jgi:hypothetical protein
MLTHDEIEKLTKTIENKYRLLFNNTFNGVFELILLEIMDVDQDYDDNTWISSFHISFTVDYLLRCDPDNKSISKMIKTVGELIRKFLDEHRVNFLTTKFMNPRDINITVDDAFIHSFEFVFDEKHKFEVSYEIRYHDF